MSELKVLIRSNNDCDGITEKIISEFRKEYDDVSGIVIDCNLAPRERDNRFQYISVESFCTLDNEYVRQGNIPIDGDILEGMLPYKSMAMHIMMRAVGYDVYDRRYLEDVYYNHVKYWNQLLDSNKINMMVFLCTPHHVGEYILYALCKVKNIDITLLYPQLTYNGTLFHIGDSIESIGENVRSEFLMIKSENNTDLKLSEFMQGVVNNTMKNRVIGYSDWDKLASAWKIKAFDVKELKVILIRYAQLILSKLGIYHRYDSEYYSNLIKYKIKARKHERKMDHLNDYSKYSVRPIAGERYIYFPLQMTPEASSMPLAGEFKNQLLSIELLAYVAKKYDLKVYVKEHWVQHNREPGFYKKLTQMENVRLISLECNSIDLIDGCEMVATQTGNCMFEAMLKGKVALSIGKGNTFKGAPNIKSVQNIDEIDSVIRQFYAGEIVIDNRDVEMYLKALDNSMVYLYLDSLDEAYKDYNKEESAKKIVYFATNQNDS